MENKKIIIICGGPSAERGISLNSARSLYDNFDKSRYQIEIVYFNPRLEPYTITPAQIYSNTPLDFDYKLSNSGTPLTTDQLIEYLKTADLVFPAIHGMFGEDGQLQKILEDSKINFIGSGSEACKNTSNKASCQTILKQNIFFTIEGWTYKKGDSLPDLPDGHYVAKPLHGGSSIGVEYFSLPNDSGEVLNKKFDRVFQVENELLIEPYFQGTEFTIIILENAQGEPIALYPTEIEFNHKDDKFFNYRKKYLATDAVRYHTPARFDHETIENIRIQSARAYQALGMKDFARIDGWIGQNGEIWFSDINAISGMEQNSFLFQQSALLGISHRQLLDYIVNKKIFKPSDDNTNREKIPVIFGGKTAERQVSVMSGTNVWMKLKSSDKYKPVALFLDTKDEIYEIPQFICLHHTVEEIEEKINKFSDPEFFNTLKNYQNRIFNDLQINQSDIEEDIFIPRKTNLEKLADSYNFLFLGLHGGDGENGNIQAKLETMQLPFNGPGSESSRICMDKYETGQIIKKAQIEGVRTAQKIILELTKDPVSLWNTIISNKFKTPLIVKPRSDGCSAGVLRIENKEQFIKVASFLKENISYIPEKAIHDYHPQIELPKEKLTEILVEEFIATDIVKLYDLEINWQTNNNYIEVTVGVLGDKNSIRALNPSQTIASQEILSLEEKFMGGTGINLTPPPEQYVKLEAVRGVRERIEKVAKALKIEGYSRIDTFMNIETGELIIIEANTLPGLTPSTVIFHQALAEEKSMKPLEFLETIIDIGKKRYEKNTSDERIPGRIGKTPQIESFEKSRI